MLKQVLIKSKLGEHRRRKHVCYHPNVCSVARGSHSKFIIDACLFQKEAFPLDSAISLNK